MALAQAEAIAELVMFRLAPAVVRIAKAGSVRRMRPDVGDIELVIVPRYRDEPINLFETRRASVLDDALQGEEWQVVKGGERYKQVLVLDRFKIDMWIQPDPATWGVNFALRTGSRDFATWLVTSREKGGALPAGMYVRDARLWRCPEPRPLETPEEEDFFRAIGLEWVRPEERENGRWWGGQGG